MQGYRERMDDWTERLSLFAAAVINKDRKPAKQIAPKKLFDREKLKLEAIKANESKDPDDIKRRRRELMRALKKDGAPPLRREHR